MRNISAESLAKIAEKVGTEPIMLLSIKWTDTNSTTYCEKALSGVHGKILNISSIDEVLKLDGVGTSGSLTVTLDDTDGELKSIIDSLDINKRPCTIYQYFDGMSSLAEAFPIFDGMIYSPIEWSEGERTVTFSIVSSTYSFEVGFAPEEGQFPGLQQELVGKVWPLCFGSPIHVPATLRSIEKTGTVLQPYVIPDYTLPLKRDLVVNRIDKLIGDYLLQQSIYSKLIELVRPAYIIQEEYAHSIVAYDNMRQSIEDFTDVIEKVNNKIEKLQKEYFDDASQVPINNITQQLQNLRSERDSQIKFLKSIYNQKRNYEQYFELVQVDIENCKYKINAMSKIRITLQDMIKEYYGLINLIDEIDLHISEQTHLNTGSLNILNGGNFPQNSPVKITVDNTTISGAFNNNIFAETGVVTDYGNLTLTPKTDDALDTIFLEDQNVKVNGKYLLLDNGAIVRATNQSGNKVTLELPRKDVNKRNKRSKVQYLHNPKDKALFDETMDRLLTGSESDADINKIANNLPKDINPKVHKILFGDIFSQYIRAKDIDFNPHNNSYQPNMRYQRNANNEVSWFTLTYGNDEETDVIYWDDTADNIKDKIVNSTSSIDSNDISVTKVVVPNSTYPMIKITMLNGLLKPFKIHRENCIPDDLEEIAPRLETYLDKKQPTKVTLTYNRDDVNTSNFDFTATGPDKVSTSGIKCIIGKYTFYLYDGSTFNNSSFTTGYIPQAVHDEFPNLTLSGGPLKTTDIVFECPDKFFGILFDFSNLYYLPNSGKDDSDIFKYPEDPTKNGFYFKVVTDGGSAFEYTNKERERRLEQEVEKNINAPAIKKYKDIIKELNKLKQQRIDDNDWDQEAELEFQNNLNKSLKDFTAVMKNVDKSTFVNDDVFKVISDKEYNQLYELELLGYMEWLNKFQEGKTELKDDDYEFTAYDINGVVEVAQYIPQSWLVGINGTQDYYDRMHKIDMLPDRTTALYIYAGQRVTLQGYYQESYICNTIASDILSVYANRSHGGLISLQPVPSQYYTINTVNYGNLVCPTVTLIYPLKKIDPSWEDQIYVTMTSSVGPNIVDILEWLITHYSNLTVDTDSFNLVRGYLANYPANFALLERKSLIQLIEEIAYQTRCSITIRNGKVYIVYLSAEPTSVATITEDDVEESTLGLTFTETEEIYTKHIANWKPHYAVLKDWQIIIRNNLTRYYTNELSKNYFIYNIEFLVEKSLTFWVIMKANAFKIAKFKLFLNHLNLEVGDCVTLNFSKPFFATEPVKALITKCNYDSSSKSIDVECWLPVLAGEMKRYTYAWPKNLSISVLWPAAYQIGSGNAGNPNGITVPTSTKYNPDDPTAYRPRDLGQSKVSDDGDSLPKNPAEEFNHITYQIPANDKPIEVKKENKDNKADDDTQLSQVDYEPTEHQENRPGAVVLGYGRILGSAGEEKVDWNKYSIDVNQSRQCLRVLMGNGTEILAYTDGYGESGWRPEMRVLVLYDFERGENLVTFPQVLPYKKV